MGKRVVYLINLFAFYLKIFYRRMSSIDSKDNTFGSDNGHVAKEDPEPNVKLAGLEVS